MGSMNFIILSNRQGSYAPETFNQFSGTVPALWQQTSSSSELDKDIPASIPLFKEPSITGGKNLQGIFIVDRLQ